MLKSARLLFLVPAFAFAQISNLTVSTTATQAILSYTAPVAGACSLKVADMNRAIRMVSAVKTGALVTVTTAAPHGLASGAGIYLEGSSSFWNGWQTVATVPSATTFTFVAGSGSGSSAGGDLGVLVDDVNPRLFVGADQDSRPGNISNGYSRVFVIGQRTAAVASNGNRYTRALQAASRHHFTLTCGTQKLDQEFTTQTLALGDTHNEGLPVDRGHPGQYAYPTVQWNNPAQALIDPMTGVRSFRATSPTGAASGAQKFQTAMDPAGSWRTPAGALSSGGSAAFSGSCANANGCPLFLRADNLSLPGGATYTTSYGEGSSLDWVTVTVSNAAAPGCSGDGCKVEACLTVDGVACAGNSREAVMTSSPAAYTFGTQSLMDLWQNSGAPAVSRVDVSRAGGTVNYNAAAHQLSWVSGNSFNIRWAAGSRITVNGAEYAIAAVQSEALLTLAGGPNADLTGASYSANNFGVLLWKKTAGPLTLGYTTFQYGSTANPVWNSYSVQSCGPAVTVDGVAGNNCFVDQELFWVAQDASDVRDLGRVQTDYAHPGNPWGFVACGQSSVPSQFDPANGDTWYCMIQIDWTGSLLSIVKAQYQGSHAAGTPGKVLPDCDVDSNVQPCMKFTIMQPSLTSAIPQSGPAFSPVYQASGYQAAYILFGGISPDGDLMVFTREADGQDTRGWQFIYTLGDRTPAGTTPSSIRPIAAASDYSKAPLSWCVLHSTGVPQDGWTMFSNNDFSYHGPGAVYSTTLTSQALNTAPGAAGGLNACPSNPFGVTGLNCTAITVTGDPVRGSDGTTLQPIEPGDLIKVDSEYLRVLVRNSSTSLVVQRGFVSTVASHTATSLPMHCGAVNALGASIAVWNYRADPYGSNANWNTIVTDPTITNGHAGSGAGVSIYEPDGWWDLGKELCPPSLGDFPACYEIRHGDYAAMLTGPVMTAAGDAPFAGYSGIGYNNNVDSHPGPCTSSFCMDARPMFGGAAGGTYTNLGGQLWKTSGATLNRKYLTTMAYAGRFALVDVSGPHSVIDGTAASSYTYCVAAVAGECHAGSNAGDVFVNAPFISTPYCYYPGIAVPNDDMNSICVGDLGTLTANLMQVGVAQEDLTGAGSRRLGPAYSRWNQQAVFWNNQANPSGTVSFSQVRWLDGVRHEDIVSLLPPYPAQDGVARNVFLTQPVALTPPSGVAANTAMVEFGYAENGDPGSFFCTSRQEACVAVSGSINQALPFYYEQTESYSGAPCAFGCTIAVPALSQHILYYRVKFRNVYGQVVYTGPTQAVATK